MAKTGEKKVAETLYIESDLSQAEIAKQLGVSSKTISEWKESGGWDSIRAARKTTRAEMITQLYASINMIMDKAKDAKRELTPADSDKIIKLATAIEKLEDGDTLSNSILALTGFFRWLKDVDLNAAKKLMNHSQDFLRTKAKNKK